MRVSNEATVDREEFLAAISRMPGGGIRATRRFSPRTRKLPKTERVMLLYSTGRLHFGRLSIEAAAAPGMKHATDGLLDSVTIPRNEAPSAAVESGQFLVPGIAAVTDRERLEHLAKGTDAGSAAMNTRFSRLCV
jgi:hypothetical protein